MCGDGVKVVKSEIKSGKMEREVQESAEEEVDRSAGGNEAELESYTRAKFTLWAYIICWTALRLLIQVSTVHCTTELTPTDTDQYCMLVCVCWICVCTMTYEKLINY